MRTKLMLAVCSIGLLLNFGCGTRSARDDGQDYASDERIIESALEGMRKARALFASGSIDYGDADKLIVVHVTDQKGNAVKTATMDARLYFSGKLYGEWTDLSASDVGDIAFFSVGYFGPLRIDILVVKADGFKPRMIKDHRLRSSDATQPITKADWDARAASFVRGLTDQRNIDRSGVDLGYHYGRSIRICYRKIVLREE